MPKGVGVRVPPSLLHMPRSQSCCATITYVVAMAISGDLFGRITLIHVNTLYVGSIPLWGAMKSLVSLVVERYPRKV